MNRKRYFFKYLVLFVAVIGLVVILGYAYYAKATHIKGNVYIALEETIFKDFTDRNLKELRAKSAPLGRKVKHIKFSNSEEFEFKDSVDENVAVQLATQYLLADMRPIHPDTFHTIFKKELEKFHIIDGTGIIYAHNGVQRYSNNDSLSLQKASVFVTKPKILDIKGTVIVQAWITLGLLDVIKNMDTNVSLSIIAYAIALIWVTISFLKKEPEDENKIRIGRILVNKEAEKVYVDGKELKLRKGLYRLLLLFVESPEHTLTKEKICQHFWPLHYKVTNNYNNLISSFRREWNDYSGCQLTINEDESMTLLFPTHSCEEKTTSCKYPESD